MRARTGRDETFRERLQCNFVCFIVTTQVDRLKSKDC
jgi:hypothetical protein